MATYASCYTLWTCALHMGTIMPAHPLDAQQRLDEISERVGMLCDGGQAAEQHAAQPLDLIGLLQTADGFEELSVRRGKLRGCWIVGFWLTWPGTAAEGPCAGTPSPTVSRCRERVLNEGPDLLLLQRSAVPADCISSPPPRRRDLS